MRRTSTPSCPEVEVLLDVTPPPVLRLCGPPLLVDESVNGGRVEVLRSKKGF